MARSCRNGVGGRTAPAGRLPSPWTAWLTIVVIPATLVLLQVVHRCWVNLDLCEHAAPFGRHPGWALGPEQPGDARPRRAAAAGCHGTAPTLSGQAAGHMVRGGVTKICKPDTPRQPA